MGERHIAPMIASSLDFVWERVRGRLEDIDTGEYLWEPVPNCWTVRIGADGKARADFEHPEPDPAPVTTIAWRTGHIAVGCLESYSERGFGRRGTDLEPLQWFLDADHALDAMDKAWAAFRAGIHDLGEDGMWRKLGPDFGPYADETYAALLLHAQDEISHHGAEIALLRDLYRNR
jgi:hypothetical protein